MVVYDIYSKRKKVAERAGQPDVYKYDALPPFLRKQIGKVLLDTIGPFLDASEWNSPPPNGNDGWEFLVEVFDREIDGFEVYLKRTQNPQEGVLRFLSDHENIDDVLSLVEMTCDLFHFMAEKNYDPKDRGAKQTGADAIEEINIRFREHGIGYRFENRYIIRVDSEYVHAEVIKPALSLLAEKLFEKANEDFMTAHRHYRHGENKDAITAAQRAFESALKAICHARGWKFEEGDTAARLVTVCRNNGLFPAYLDDGLNTYVSMLKTGLPGVRNNAGGHGEHPEAPKVAAYIAAYALHMTATNIVLAANAFKALA